MDAQAVRPYLARNLTLPPFGRAGVGVSFPLNIPAQAFISQHFDVVIKPEYEATNAQIAHHIGFEKPVMLVFGREKPRRNGVLFKHKIVGKLAHAQPDAVALLARKAEHVGEDTLMKVGMHPRCVVDFNLSDARQLECFVRSRCKFVATHVLMVVQKEERFDHTVAE